MLREFFRLYVRQHGLKYLTGLVCLVATVELTVAIPGWIKQVVDELANGRRLSEVHRYAGWIALAAVAVIGVRTLSRVLFFNPGREIEYQVRNDMLKRLLWMSPRYFRRQTLGDLMARAGDDATYVRALVGFTPVMALNIVVSAVVAAWQMWRTDAWLTLACVLPSLAALVVLRRGVQATMGWLKRTQQTLGELSERVLETYKGIAVVQGAAAEAAFIARFDETNDRFTEQSLRSVTIRTLVMPVVAVVGNLCILLLLYIGGQHVVARQLTIGDMAAYASYVGVLVGALASAGWVAGVIQRGFVSLQRVWEVLELASDLSAGATPLTAAAAGLHLEVRGLTWRHADAPANAPPVLTDIHFDLRPGRVLGIYGPVGAGKSTLVQLLSRQQPPPPNTVFIDGVDLLEVADADLRRAMAVVPQDAFLFSRSVRDNVGFIDRAGDIDPARVEQALTEAQLAGEVARFAEGLDTVVGERGLSISGGQRQRVQLARAFYRGFRLLVLDDVLSAVDHDTEARLLEILQAAIAARGTSAVIISHRLSALQRADEILVLDGGRISERGTHAALVLAGGTYAKVWQAQQDAPVQRTGFSAGPAVVAEG
jgi:ATP-binding cassette subfamily B protein